MLCEKGSPHRRAAIPCSAPVGCTYFTLKNSMRRFFALPSGVVLSAIGFSAPKPFTPIRAPSIPFATSHALTASARRRESFLFACGLAGVVGVATDLDRDLRRCRRRQRGPGSASLRTGVRSRPCRTGTRCLRARWPCRLPPSARGAFGTSSSGSSGLEPRVDLCTVVHRAGIGVSLQRIGLVRADLCRIREAVAVGIGLQRIGLRGAYFFCIRKSVTIGVCLERIRA